MKMNKLPIDIKFQDGVLMDGGVMFVTIRSVEELEAFWFKNKGNFQFAARGIKYGDQQLFLDEDEWIFAPTKVTLIKALCRWDDIGIRCEFYNWSQHDPICWESFFLERDDYRARCMAEGVWSATQEARYQADCKKRSPETYRGWWRLVNLPDNLSDTEWFSQFCDKEFIDPLLPVAEVERMLQELTFDDWSETDVMPEVGLMDHAGVVEHIGFLHEYEDERLYMLRHGAEE